MASTNTPSVSSFDDTLSYTLSELKLFHLTLKEEKCRVIELYSYGKLLGYHASCCHSFSIILKLGRLGQVGSNTDWVSVSVVKCSLSVCHYWSRWRQVQWPWHVNSNLRSGSRILLKLLLRAKDGEKCCVSKWYEVIGNKIIFSLNSSKTLTTTDCQTVWHGHYTCN